MPVLKRRKCGGKRMTIKQALKTLAESCSTNAFALKSETKLGACVLTEDGEIYEGCNIEANISGLGICAERLAIDHAILHGKYAYKALALYVNSEKTPIPCGACLQYLMEFKPLAKKDITIYCFSKDKSKTYKLSKLLPKGYVGKRSIEKASKFATSLTVGKRL